MTAALRAAPLAALLLRRPRRRGRHTAGPDTAGPTDAEPAAALRTDIADRATRDRVTGWEGVVPSSDRTHGDVVRVRVNPTAAAALAAATGCHATGQAPLRSTTRQAPVGPGRAAVIAPPSPGE